MQPLGNLEIVIHCSHIEVFEQHWKLVLSTLPMSEQQKCELKSLILYLLNRYQLISEAILLFTNYYSLFKIVRDYIVFSRLSYTDKEGKENWCCIVCTRCNSCWKHRLNQIHVMIQLSISQKMKETRHVINSSWLSLLFHNQCAARLFWHFFAVKLVLVQCIFLFV